MASKPTLAMVWSMRTPPRAPRITTSSAPRARASSTASSVSDSSLASATRLTVTPLAASDASALGVDGITVADPRVDREAEVPGMARAAVGGDHDRGSLGPARPGEVEPDTIGRIAVREHNHLHGRRCYCPACGRTGPPQTRC